ncbi:MAG: hypothetical protein KatS3mg068_0241 [Candidatus Sericytochromatia bacterium]|nr:MAG: hypothetical protein KatS3mg068_0241 [Candidatus Sericytochromatia bacterium]
MIKTSNINYYLDSCFWTSGVTDDFFLTPLGFLSTPLKIDEIADVEWTIVFDNFIYIQQIDQEIQLKYWLRIPEKYRNKIKKNIELNFPFDEKKIRDRYLIAYSVENEKEKFIGFIFESILDESKVPMYVFTQAKINTNIEAKEYLKQYLNKVNNNELEERKTIIKKIINIFSRK